MKEKTLTGAQLLVKCLEKNGVKMAFGIPGAKIDAVFDALVGSSIRLILCRHEQNAAFMAAAHGRMTGEPGVVIVTSGPGVANLVTGLLTATTEGDPVVAIGGCVPRNMLLKSTHQNADNVHIMSGVTKSSILVTSEDNIPEAIENSFRIACEPRRGACFITVPQDVLTNKTEETPLRKFREIEFGPASDREITRAAEIVNKSACPVLFLGEEASVPKNAKAVRSLLKKHPIPVIATYQGAGCVTRELVDRFVGRVGLFRNQPGDKLLDMADAVVTVGFNEAEYDPEAWNAARKKKIVHIDYKPSRVHSCYEPAVDVVGDIDRNIARLSGALKVSLSPSAKDAVKRLQAVTMKFFNYDPSSPQSAAKMFGDADAEFARFIPSSYKKNRIHPMQFIHAFRSMVTDDDIIACDIGTVYMWMARCFVFYRPRHLLFSNGQQTLGVALPWAIAAKLAFPKRRVFSISGDGGFLFSSMELETAVREKTPVIHIIWSDGTYNMVAEQQKMKYQRTSGVDLGRIDVESYARSFGAKGYRLKTISDLDPVIRKALRNSVPSLIDIPIDYSQNKEMFISARDARIQ
ncbi:MAG TPA: acetolactate synthase AlsS [bacterium]|nr:acetolactate synthase AlsS [bacterium]